MLAAPEIGAPGQQGGSGRSDDSGWHSGGGSFVMAGIISDENEKTNKITTAATIIIINSSINGQTINAIFYCAGVDHHQRS